MDPKQSRAWIDLYSLTLDRLAEFLADPQKRALKMGITKEELAKQEAKLPRQISLEEYRIQQDSWKNVSREIIAFGLQLGDDLLLAPQMEEMSTKAWRTAPWLFVFREAENIPLRFYGRDALTALGFFNFFIQHCDNIDPTKRIREELEAQGVTEENFNEHFLGTSITNPWRPATVPVEQATAPSQPDSSATITPPTSP
jgi:hypothetical protein